MLCSILLKAKGAEQRRHDRVRPALYAHRRPCDGVRPLPPRHRCRSDLGSSSGTFSRTAGRTKEYIRQRVWGLNQVREEVKKWTPEETEKVTGVPGIPAASRRAHAGHQQARHLDLVHGWHPAHQRQQQYAGLLRAAVGARQHRRFRWWCQHLPRPRQRPGRHRPSACCVIRCRATTASKPVPGSTGAASGMSTTTTW